MTPERKAELIAEFEKENPKPERKDCADHQDFLDALNIYTGMRRGWLQAHSDSDMAKDAAKSEWVWVSKSVPDVPLGDDAPCWVLVERPCGKYYVTEAWYVNGAIVPVSESEDWELSE